MPLDYTTTQKGAHSDHSFDSVNTGLKGPRLNTADSCCWHIYGFCADSSLYNRGQHTAAPGRYPACCLFL